MTDQSPAEALAQRLDRELPPGRSPTARRTDDPLVNSALMLARTRAPAMSPASIARIQRQVVQAHARRNAGAQEPYPRSRRAAVVRWALAASFILALLVASLTPAAASSLPGDWLYPVKELMERGELALAFSWEQRALVHVQQAERRTQEAVLLLERGRFDSTLIVEALESMEDSAYAAEASHDPALEAALLARTTQLADTLETVLKRAQETAADQTAVAPVATVFRDAMNNGALLLPPTETPTPTPSATPVPTPTDSYIEFGGAFAAHEAGDDEPGPPPCEQRGNACDLPGVSAGMSNAEQSEQAQSLPQPPPANNGESSSPTHTEEEPPHAEDPPPAPPPAAPEEQPSERSTAHDEESEKRGDQSSGQPGNGRGNRK